MEPPAERCNRIAISSACPSWLGVRMHLVSVLSNLSNTACQIFLLMGVQVHEMPRTVPGQQLSGCWVMCLVHGGYHMGACLWRTSGCVVVSYFCAGALVIQEDAFMKLLLLRYHWRAEPGAVSMWPSGSGCQHGSPWTHACMSYLGQYKAGLTGTLSGWPGAQWSGELLAWFLCSSARITCEKKAEKHKAIDFVRFQSFVHLTWFRSWEKPPDCAAKTVSASSTFGEVGLWIFCDLGSLLYFMGVFLNWFLLLVCQTWEH